MGFISIAKPLAITVFVDSGAPLEGRVALGPAREPAFGSSRRPAAGFRCLRRCAEVYQKRPNYPVDSDRRQPTPIVTALPRQAQVCHTSALA
jgi:hypothetical protein